GAPRQAARYHVAEHPRSGDKLPLGDQAFDGDGEGHHGEPGDHPHRPVPVAHKVHEVRRLFHEGPRSLIAWPTVLFGPPGGGAGCPGPLRGLRLGTPSRLRSCAPSHACPARQDLVESAAMTRMVKCAKLGETLPGLPYKPFNDALGQRIYESVSAEAWKQ